jgi:F-box/WD-40 domain protein 5
MHYFDAGPSLAERITELRVREERRQENVVADLVPDFPAPLSDQMIDEKFDKPDHVIDLNGHIIGMGLSPDHRYLYVNSRPWPDGAVIADPLNPPPIAEQIDMHVIDMLTLREVGTMLRSHRAHTSNDQCFFIFLNVSDQYIAR